MKLAEIPAWMAATTSTTKPNTKTTKAHTEGTTQRITAPRADVQMSRRQQEQMVHAAAERMRSTPEGQRNDTLNRIVYELGQQQTVGLDGTLVREELGHAAKDAGLTDQEIESTFNSAWAAAGGGDAEVPEAFDPDTIETVDDLFAHVSQLANLGRDELAATKRIFKDKFEDALDLKELNREVSRYRKEHPGSSPPSRITIPYLETAAGIFWKKETKEGPQRIQLTNFPARITADITEDDGAEKRRTYEIEADSGRGPRRFRIAASAFMSMNWPSEHLGASAIIFPTMSAREHARVAIQLLSGDVPEQVVFTHTGWRELPDGTLVYLHGGGALGAGGPVKGVEVRLPDELARFCLPTEEGDQVVAVQATLRMLELVPDTIGFSLLGAIFRAPCGTCDFSLFLAGPTGVGKSELAALVQQHFGPEMDRLHLPGAYSSTANSLEATAFQVKDAVLVVDDFAPGGSIYDVQKLHQQADRLLRGQGNRQGRQRMRPDGTLRPPKPPRGLIISTGEDVPRGQSLRARIVVLEIGPETLDFTKLTTAQKEAREGVYAWCLAGVIRYLAGQHSVNHKAEILKLRDQVVRSDAHRRTPDVIANLAYGMRVFLDHAQRTGAITEGERSELWERAWAALLEVGRGQAAHQAASEPVQRFFELLAAAIGSGRAHVATAEGNAPHEPGAWGWRELEEETRPLGHKVGWLDKQDLYLDSDAALVAAQEVGRQLGESLAVSSRTLRKRLSEKGLLQSQDAVRQTFTIRRRLEGRERNVIHLPASVLSALPETDKPDISASEAGKKATGRTRADLRKP